MKEKDWEQNRANRDTARLACETAFEEKKRALSERGEVKQPRKMMSVNR